MKKQRPLKLSTSYQRLHYVLHVNGGNQANTAGAIGISTATVSSGKNNPAFNPRPKVRRAIDTAFTRTSVLWSDGLEAVFLHSQQIVRQASTMDTTTGEEETHVSVWCQLVVLVRTALSDWWVRAQDRSMSAIERIYYGRHVAFLMADYAYGLRGMPESLRALCGLSAEEAITIGKNASELVLRLLADDAIKAKVFETTKCEAPEIAWRALWTKATNSSLLWAYRADSESADVFRQALDNGFGDDCEFMSKLCPRDPGWYNARWQAAMRAGSWKKTARYAAFLTKPRFRPLLKEGLYDLEPLVSDDTAQPGLAAVLAHPQDPELAELVHTLQHDRSPEVRKMTEVLEQMVEPIKSEMSYSEVMKAASKTRGDK